MAAPTCTITVKIDDINGSAPTGDRQFWVAGPGDPSAAGNITAKQTVTGGGTATITVDATARDTLMANSHNTALTHSLIGWPADTGYMLALVLDPATAVTNISGTITPEGQAGIAFSAELTTGKNQTRSWLGIYVYRATNGVPDAAGTPTAKTYAQYYTDRHLPVATGNGGAAPTALSKFRCVDTSSFGDRDLKGVRAVAKILRELGRNTIVLQTNESLPEWWALDSHNRGVLQAEGVPSVAINYYRPPGDGKEREGSYSGDSPELPTDAGVDAWAQRAYDYVVNAGYAASALGLIITADEPGWFSQDEIHGDTNVSLHSAAPSGHITGINEAAGITLFRDWLQTQRDHDGNLLTPSYFGAATWSEVTALGWSARTGTLGQRRAFFWTIEYVHHTITVVFKRCCDKLRLAERFGPGCNVGPNLGYFHGRIYLPGTAIAHPDPDPAPADRGTHSLSVLDFGRDQGGNAHYEDFGSDVYAFFVSNYMARARSGTDRYDINYYPGSYPGPHYSGYKAKGHLKRLMAALAHGVKSFYFYAYGPPQVFGGVDGYGEAVLLGERGPRLIADEKDFCRILGFNENKLFEAKNRKAQVAIAYPSVGQRYDGGNAIDRLYDGTNPYLLGSTVDYTMEAHCIQFALMHQNVPVDWLHWRDLTAPYLADYKVLYLTDPNLPVEAQNAIATWVNNGGVLVMTCGAAQRDIANDATSILSTLGGITETAYTPKYISDLFTTTNSTAGGNVGPVGGHRYFVYDLTGGFGESIRSTISGGTTLATYETSGDVAWLRATHGSGRVYKANHFPASMYTRLATQPSGVHDLPENWQTGVIDYLVTQPITQAGIVRPTETGTTMIETQVLVAPDGSWVIPMIHWRNTADASRSRKVRPPFTPSAITSFRSGALGFTADGAGGYDFSMPLADVDLVVVEGAASPDATATPSTVAVSAALPAPAVSTGEGVSVAAPRASAVVAVASPTVGAQGSTSGGGTLVQSGSAVGAATNFDTTLSWSFTVSAGDNRRLIVGAVARDQNGATPPVISATYAGQAMTVDRTATIGAVRVSQLSLPAPPVGTASVVVSVDIVSQITGHARQFDDCHQSVIGATDQAQVTPGTAIHLPMTSAAGELVVDTLWGDGGATITAQSPQMNVDTQLAGTSAPHRSGSSIKSGGDVDTSMSWTIDPEHWALIVAVVYKPTTGTQDAQIGPTPSAAVSAVPTANVVGAASASPAVVTTTGSLPPPTPHAGSVSAVAVVATTSAVPAPVTGVAATVAPSSVATTSAIPETTSSAGSVSSPVVVVVPCSVPAAALSTGSVISASVIATAGDAPTPVVVIEGGAATQPDDVPVTVAVPATDLVTSSALAPDVISTSTSLPSSVVSSGATSAPTAVVVSSEAPATSVVVDDLASPVTVLAASTVAAIAPVTSASTAAVTVTTVAGVPSAAVSTGALLIGTMVGITAVVPGPVVETLALAQPDPAVAVGTVESPEIVAISPKGVPMTIRDRTRVIVIG